MANIFTGKLELTMANVVPGELNQWDIVANFVDSSGMFYASDAVINDIIYIDGTLFNYGMLRYKIVYIDPTTSFDTIYCRVIWELANEEPIEPLCGFESIIGRAILGAVFLPSVSIQQLSESFIRYVSNIEAWLAARYSYANRALNAPYIGVKDGENKVFSLVDPFLLDTLKVKFNGMEQRLNIDFTIEGKDITLVTAPHSDDSLVFDCNRS